LRIGGARAVLLEWRPTVGLLEWRGSEAKLQVGVEWEGMDECFLGGKEGEKPTKTQLYKLQRFGFGF
jgi:hypothetical protein